MSNNDNLITEYLEFNLKIDRYAYVDGIREFIIGRKINTLTKEEYENDVFNSFLNIYNSHYVDWLNHYDETDKINSQEQKRIILNKNSDEKAKSFYQKIEQHLVEQLEKHNINVGNLNKDNYSFYINEFLSDISQVIKHFNVEKEKRWKSILSELQMTKQLAYHYEKIFTMCYLVVNQMKSELKLSATC